MVHDIQKNEIQQVKANHQLPQITQQTTAISKQVLEFSNQVKFCFGMFESTSPAILFYIFCQTVTTATKFQLSAYKPARASPRDLSNVQNHDILQLANKQLQFAKVLKRIYNLPQL